VPLSNFFFFLPAVAGRCIASGVRPVNFWLPMSGTGCFTSSTRTGHFAPAQPHQQRDAFFPCRFAAPPRGHSLRGVFGCGDLSHATESSIYCMPGPHNTPPFCWWPSGRFGLADFLSPSRLRFPERQQLIPGGSASRCHYPTSGMEVSVRPFFFFVLS